MSRRKVEAKYEILSSPQASELEIQSILEEHRRTHKGRRAGGVAKRLVHKKKRSAKRPADDRGPKIRNS